MRLLRIRHSDDAARNSATSVADRLAPIVHFCVNDYAATNNRILGPHYRNVADRDFVVSLALVVRLDVSEVTGVPVFIIRQTMLMAFWVVVASGAHGVRRGAIAILVNVEGVLLARRESFDVGNNFHRFSILGETHNAVALLPGCRVQDGHGFGDISCFGRMER